MGDWYSIGLAAGLGAGIGVVAAALVGWTRAGFVLAMLVGAAAGLGAGFGIGELDEAVAGAVGGVLCAAGATPLVRGALGRGGTRGGTALLVGLGGLVVAAVAFVPALGYVEALAVPLLGARMRRRAGDRYAGLRVLARD